MNSLSETFPSFKSLLYIWHINKIFFFFFLAKVRPLFHLDNAWKDYMRLWQTLTNSQTDKQHNLQLEQLRERVPKDYIHISLNNVARFFALKWISWYLVSKNQKKIMGILQCQESKKCIQHSRSGFKHLLMICNIIGPEVQAFIKERVTIETHSDV